MLGVLCARPKPRLLASLSLSHGGYNRSHTRSVLVKGGEDQLLQRRHHSTHCRRLINRGGAALIWHLILPARKKRRNTVFHHHHCELTKKGEGSWNVAWDARPARWLHNPDSAWLLFGVCSCLAASPSLDLPIDNNTHNDLDTTLLNSDPNYRVTGVPADGRCLFRAIAHMACLKNGEEAPDENRQRQLADELRAQVVDELLKRRKEAEWFIEGDFDAYVERIEKPYVWGGEPELLMASHVLKSRISVYMVDRSSGSLINISNYGEEYRKGEESPINVLFHGYGHYDILETISEEKVEQKQEE